MNDLVLENLISLKVEDDDSSTNVIEKRNVKDRIQLLIDYMTSFSNSNNTMMTNNLDFERL